MFQLIMYARCVHGCIHSALKEGIFGALLTDCEPERQQWEDWLNDLPEMSNMSINRCIKPHDLGPVKDYQLHHFSDASEKALSAVSYLMMVNTEGKVCCSLLMAKSRLAPLKKCCVAGGLRGIEFSYKLLLMLRYQIRSQYVKKENSSSGIYNSKMVFIIEFQTPIM